MKRDEALQLLREHEAELHALGVAHAHLFGSVARDEATDESDVDVFVTHTGKGFSWFSLFPVKTYLEQLFRRDVDLFTFEGLAFAPHTQQHVQQDLINVF